jgi:hypothetical protein
MDPPRSRSGQHEQGHRQPEDQSRRARLTDHLATIDTIVGTPAISVTGTTVAEVRNSAQSELRALQQQIKLLARGQKRVIRRLVGLLDAAD